MKLECILSEIKTRSDYSKDEIDKKSSGTRGLEGIPH